MMSAKGFVYLVGAGPGDPELLTLRGLKVLQSADVLIYDSLVSPRLIEICPPQTQRIYVGKRRGHHELSQSEINSLLVKEAGKGLTVVRLKGGDPYVFGRGAEEAECLYQAGIPFRVVPGVTAGVGALAYAGIPVTHRDYSSSVVFVTGHDDPDSDRCRVNWPHLATFDGTIVIYMGVTRLKRITQVLIEHGMPENMPVALVRNGSWPDQLVKTTTLLEVATSGEGRLIEPPALIVIGEVVNARRAIDWWSRLPLAGKTVLVTRPENEAHNTVSALEDLGARVLVAPAITIRPIDNPGSLDQTLLRLNLFDWLVFTSANGVRFFIRRIFQIGFDIRLLGHIRIAAIGPGTAKALEEYGIKADLIPPKYRSEELANALAEHVKGKKVLLARADRGRTVLKDELDPIADEVVQVPVYHNADADSIPEEVLQEIRNNQVDWVLLTSSAIARRFAAMLPSDEAQNLIGKIKFASISPVTSDAARAVGIEPTVEAEVFTLAGLIDAIIEFQ